MIQPLLFTRVTTDSVAAGGKFETARWPRPAVVPIRTWLLVVVNGMNAGSVGGSNDFVQL